LKDPAGRGIGEQQHTQPSENRPLRSLETGRDSDYFRAAINNPVKSGIAYL
jgi:hypothetical protein